MVDIFSKYVMKDENKSEVFHSSAYGQAQNGGSMGAASTESFEARRNQDQNRQFIKNFNSSKLAGSAFSPVSRPAIVKPGDIPSSRIASAPGAARPAAPARPQMSRPPMRQNPGIHR